MYIPSDTHKLSVQSQHTQHLYTVYQASGNG